MGIRRLTLLSALFLSACATKQVRDPANDKDVVEMMEQSKREEQTSQFESSASILKQDLGALTFKERSEAELLKNFENEISQAGVHVEGLLPTDEREPATENPKAKMQSSFFKNKFQPTTLSKEELTAQLFDADSITVQKGDSLGSLAEKHFGNKKAWNSIWALNPNLHDPNKLEIGEKLFIPRGMPSRSIASTPAPAAPVAVASTSVAPAAPKAPAAPSAPVKVESAKEIPKLKSEVEHKVLKAEAKKKTEDNFIVEPAPKVKEEVEAPPSKEEQEVLEGAFLPAGTWTASSHSTDELLREHLDLNRFRNFKGRLPDESLQRRAASVNEAGVASEEAEKAPTIPKNLTSIVSYIGLFLLLAVLGGFFFSKPQKNS